MSKDIVALYAYVCLLGGVGLFFFGFVIWNVIRILGAYNQIKDSKSWPKTTGLITHSSIEQGFTRIGGSYIYVNRPEVVYEYEVDGKKYTSSQLALVEVNTASEDLARGKAEKYVSGQHVEVYYDPRNPKCAVLTIGDAAAAI
jgi:hypothetical protein